MSEQNKLTDTQEFSGDRGGRGGGGWQIRGQGVTTTVTEGDVTLGGEHINQYPDDVLLCT